MFLFKKNKDILKFNLFCTIHSKTQRNTKIVCYPKTLKELNLDSSLVSNAYAKQISARLRAKQLSFQLLPLTQIVRQLRNQRDHNPLRIFELQLSNIEQSHSTKEEGKIQKKVFPRQRRRAQYELRFLLRRNTSF